MSEYKGFGQQIEISLIAKAQAGDVSSMEAIYKAYAKPCYLLAIRITSNPSASQDIVHEVFLKVIKKITQFKASGNFAGWIRQITANESIDYLKRNSRIQEQSELDETLEASSQFETQWWDTIKDLDKLTSKLSDSARAVLFLHELEGFSHKEIAALFGKTESFSKQSLSRAFSQLKNMNAIKEVSDASL
jgi:RNA polymerase sigma factor (sigma-70 family)